MTETGLAVLALRRRLREQAAGEVRALPGATALRCPDLPAVPDLNALHLDAPAPPDLTGLAVERLTERWLGDVAHHHVVLDDAAAGERLSAELEPGGWSRRRVGVMVLEADAPGPPAGVTVRALDEPELVAIQRAAMAEQAPSGISGEVLDQLARGAARLRAAADRAIGCGALRDGAPVASATLLLGRDRAGDRLAVIEEVGTLRAHREQGLGRAVVLAAVSAARQAGARHVAVCVDADDWPQLMYARLGFVPVARQVTLSRALRARGSPRRGVASADRA